MGNGDAHANDDNGHGTHVAGTIAQSTNNSIGTYSAVVSGPPCARWRRATPTNNGTGTYSAVVTSSGQPIVGLIQQHGEQGQALNHNAFNGGSTRAYCPNLNTNLGPEQWNTPIIIQNVGSSATNLTISYYRSSTGTLDKVVAVSGLASGRSHVALPHQESGLVQNSGYSAVIESSSQPIVALVNQHGSLSGDQNLGNECLNS